MTGLHVVLGAGEVGDDASRLHDQHSARRHVPWRQPQLEKAVGPPAGDIGHVERRGAGPPDAAARAEQLLEDLQVLVQKVLVLERKAGDQERFL